MQDIRVGKRKDNFINGKVMFGEKKLKVGKKGRWEKGEGGKRRKNKGMCMESQTKLWYTLKNYCRHANVGFV